MPTYRSPRTAILLLAALVASGTVLAGPPESGARANKQYDEKRYTRSTSKWLGGQYVEVCRQGAAMTCARLKIPKGVGKIERVIPGPVIASARASWLVASRFDTFVCAALEASPTIACAKVAAPPLPLQHAGVTFEITPANRTRLAFQPASKKVDGARLESMARDFRAAFWKSARVLQGEIDNVNASSAPFSGMLSICDNQDPGPPPHPDCTLVEEGGVQMWSCPITGDPPPTDPPDPGWPEWPEWPDPEDPGYPDCP